MPLQFARGLTARERTARSNAHLGIALAFIAGATNAGGFLAVHQYTSHMTGIVSSIADNLVLGSFDLVLGGIGALLSFLLGAMSAAVLVNLARRRHLFSEYALPLLAEAGLLLCFGFLGARLQQVAGLFVPATVMLLCYIMGLQNAVISKISRAEIRTTHLTGTITDIGIELGKLFYWNSDRAGVEKVQADMRRLRRLFGLASSFLLGGAVGAFGFSHLGYLCTVPLAIGLIALGCMPAFDDIRSAWDVRGRR